MSDLKTLKELDRRDFSLIKKEGIKWVKHWFNVLNSPEFLINEKHCVGFKEIVMEGMNRLERDACASIGAFVNFFSITKEDLEDE